MAIGSLTLTPTFSPTVENYAVTTTNATNTVTATTNAVGASVEIKVNGETIDSGDSVAWNVGDNTVVVKITQDGYTPHVYTITVTKTE